MGTEEARFETFLLDVHPAYQAFLRQMHEYLLGRGFSAKLTPARSGYTVSYRQPKNARVALNYVFRKSGLFARVYGDHVNSYPGVLEGLPESMRKAVAKAPACKRLLDPMACSSRCPMGYAFSLNGEMHKKCRYFCFLFKVDDESIPHIQALIENEALSRVNA